MNWGSTGQYQGQQVSYGNSSATHGAAVANLDGRNMRTRKRVTPTYTLYHQDGTAGAVYTIHTGAKVTGVAAQHTTDYGFLFANKAGAFLAGVGYYYAYIAECEL
jgi:beta-lactamase class A